jgi:zinc-RING finger domain
MMDSSTSPQNTTSDLCTKLLDDVRDLRSSSARSAYYLSKSTTSNLSTAPAMLSLVTSLLWALEKPLMHLRYEIESGLPLEDLHQLSKSAEDTISELQNIIQTNGRSILGTELLLQVAENLYTIYETAIALTAACKLLDDDLCHATHPWSDGDSLSDLECSSRAAKHEQLLAKLESDGRECPICFEEMGADADDNNDRPATTRCGHIFCAECIERAVEEQQRCPMCRKEIRHTGLILTSRKLWRTLY